MRLVDTTTRLQLRYPLSDNPPHFPVFRAQCLLTKTSSSSQASIQSEDSTQIPSARVVAFGPRCGANPKREEEGGSPWHLWY